MADSTKLSPVLGPAARMRCRRCGRVFSVRPGRIIAHDRRQGSVYRPCDGVLAVDASDHSRQAEE